MDLRCKRCDQPLVYVGERAYHEGFSWSELFVHKDVFDLYRCPVCKGFEFFEAAGQKDPADPNPDQLTWRCECDEVNIRSEEYCRKCSAPRRYDL